MVKNVKSKQAEFRYIGNSKDENHLDCNAKIERKELFSLVNEIAKAQFSLADEELTKRLWNHVLDLGIDTGRIINLLYCCQIYEDYESMLEADLCYLDKEGHSRYSSLTLLAD